MGWTFQADQAGAVARPRLNPPDADAHKYDRGHAVVISGPRHRTGASRLAALAALRVGAGLVTIVGDATALDEQAAHVTSIMLRTRDPDFTAIDDRVRAIAIGPGLGTGQDSRDAVLTLLARNIPTVLDADALTAFADRPERLFDHLHRGCVLTPHSGEFTRLFPNIVLTDRCAAARAAATMSGATVLLKGPETHIATLDGRSIANRHATRWLATAGAGDVLTGIITGLLAQGVDPFEAAAMAAWLHGEAGRRGGAGLIAEDLPGLLPSVLHDCLTDPAARPDAA